MWRTRLASGRILNCHLQSVGADGSKSAAFAVWRSMRHCSSCPSPLPPLSTAKSEKRESQSPSVRGYSSSSSTPKVPDDTAPDHRTVATSQNLFFTTSVSPGSPIFLPNGARIFNKLTSFLRAQYALYGFEEVLSPTIYKKSLWQQSGHWENYKNDMFEVRGRGASGLSGGAVAGAGGALELGEEEEYGLKPMNCPGHCLIYRSSNKSYRDLPIRYADFSPLHRNEISGALSGLTRVRRFHQDDAHIFCRPSQISSEISSTLEFIDVVYRVFHLPSYKLRLSTRPEKYIGAPDEWDRAELALKEALGASGREWSVNEGDGAFYGPKIDIILKDSDGKEHQTATIQLDFQLPARFELQYLAPAPESERRGTQSHDPKELSEHGLVTPVIIHRAILGSLERFMALLIEHYNGRWPFWLSPRQAIIIPVAATEGILSYARTVRGVLSGIDVQEQEDTMIGVEHDEQRMTTANVDLRESPAKHIRPLPLGRRTFQVDIDTSTNSLSKKIREARTKQYNHVIVVGEKNMGAGSISVQSWVTGMGTQATSMKDGRPGYTDAEEMSAKELYDIFLTMEKRYL